MTTVIVLLRGINVSTGTRVPMAELRRIATAAGYAGVATLLNSGNLVLDTTEDAATVAARVRAGLHTSLGRDVDTIAITADELDVATVANPFPDEAADDPAHLLVTWYLEPPDADRVAAFDPSRYGPERMRWHDGVSYTWYPAGIGRSALTPAVLTRALGPGTARNWSTVLKVAASVRARR